MNARGDVKELEIMHKQVAAPPLAAVRRKRPKWRRRLIIVGVLLALVAGFFLLSNKGNKVVIRVQPAAIRDITQTVSATGKVRP
ncbi:MAG TPA: hypothetical protein VHY59_08665, partial [Chthoniobacterales bacterium]|nr:hypothetical protein [Chthoniobacterales bacterium]